MASRHLARRRSVATRHRPLAHLAVGRTLLSRPAAAARAVGLYRRRACARQFAARRAGLLVFVGHVYRLADELHWRGARTGQTLLPIYAIRTGAFTTAGSGGGGGVV